ncbi:SurA N-terminal domain-containing protein [Alcaligenaceae bacterium B3P038]|nr:SurA N-terminal domain-containing protein [Alcaligenaceae bacterium B3P038]
MRFIAARGSVNAWDQGLQLFDFIRNHRRWMQVILLVLIVPSFFLVGIQGYDSFVNKAPDMAVVGESAISQADFDAMRRDRLERLRQSMRERFDAARLDTPASRQALLDQMIDQRLLAAVAIDNRFSVSDETLRNTIASIPAVQDDGRFSPELYRQVLASQGMSPAQFEAGLRRDLAVARVIEPVGQSARVPTTVANSVDSALTQTRSVQTRRFDAAAYRDRVTVSDQDIKAWYDANQQALQIPENASVRYVVLDEAAATTGVEVKDADIATYYKQNQNRFGQPERRRASHILIQVPAGASADVRKTAQGKAAALAAQAASNPAGFAELARQNSQDAGSAANGGDLGWIVKGVFPPALDSAINSLAADQVSGVVESPSGYHVLKVTAVEAPTIKPLADVRDTIVAEIKQQEGAKRFAEMATTLTKQVNDQRDSLEPAAEAAGLKVRTATGVTRDGLLPAEQAGAGAASASRDADILSSPRVREALFSNEVLREKFNSGVIELAANKMVVVRLDALKPAQVPPLASVTDRVRTTLRNQKAAEAAKQAGEAELATLRTTPVVTVPAGFGPTQMVSRREAGDLSQSVLNAVVQLPVTPVPAYTGVADGSDYVVVRLESVSAGKPDAQAQAMLTQQLNDAWAQAEDAAVIRMLREQYKVKVTPEAERIIKGEATAEG